MTTKPYPKKILDEAMQLEPTARAFIAETLIESLDLDQDIPVFSEWLGGNPAPLPGNRKRQTDAA